MSQGITKSFAEMQTYANDVLIAKGRAPDKEIDREIRETNKLKKIEWELV